MSEPLSLYRFLDSDAALETIATGKFRIGRVSDFNDPFEWRLGFKGITTPQEQQIAGKISADHLPWFDEIIGILCFSGSESVEKPILWSLYADKHRGVAFEIKYPWPKDHLHEMSYTEDRPVLDFSHWRQLRDQKTRESYLLSVIDGLRKQKSSGWSFEEEYRIFIDLRNPINQKLGDGYHHWPIPKTALRRIVFGYRCPLEESVVSRMLDKNGFVDAKITRATMSSETYTVRC